MEVDLFVYDENDLLLANTLDYGSAHDLVYFIMNAREHSGIRDRITRILLTGTAPIDKEWKDLTETYLDKVRIWKQVGKQELCSPILFREEECES